MRLTIKTATKRKCGFRDGKTTLKESKPQEKLEKCKKTFEKSGSTGPTTQRKCSFRDGKKTLKESRPQEKLEKGKNKHLLHGSLSKAKL